MSLANNVLSNDGEESRVWPRWTQLLCPAHAMDGELEIDWLDQALQGESIAALWFGEQSLVAPRTYRQYAKLDQACHLAELAGWPVRLRRSGGGVVSQGEGIFNVSLAFPCSQSPGDIAQTLYVQLCQLLADALGKLGLTGGKAQAVEGSFCDGRFNLALPDRPTMRFRKVAGTAQYWKRSQDRQAVLLHALILVNADPAYLTDIATDFETNLESGKRYQTGSLTSVEQAWKTNFPQQPIPDNLMQHLKHQLITALQPLSH